MSTPHAAPETPLYHPYALTPQAPSTPVLRMGLLVFITRIESTLTNARIVYFIYYVEGNISCASGKAQDKLVE